MRLNTILLLAVPILGLAQAPPAAPPPEVDQALRAQATAFLKYQSEGNYRKAYEMVSEESKDYYLGITKTKSLTADIAKIEYFDDFTKAVVSSSAKQTLLLLGHAVEVPTGANDRWRLEDGQWKWYHDPSTDVVMTVLGAGPAPAPQSSSGPATQPKLPTDFSAEAVAAAAAKIAPPQATVNHRSLPFTVGQEATQEIVFHNNAPGQVRVDADLLLDYPGFVVEPKSSLLDPQADATFKVTYHPSDKGVFKAVLRLTVQPFGTEYRIPLRLSKEAAPQKP